MSLFLSDNLYSRYALPSCMGQEGLQTSVTVRVIHWTLYFILSEVKISNSFKPSLLIPDD